MKLILLLGSLVFMTVSKNSCTPNLAKTIGNCYKGRLEVKGGCMNYTISILSGKPDTSLIQSSWTDETTGKTYHNVFALGSRCNFPSTLNAGDEFYFKIDENAPKNCAVCMMYYPTPAKHLSIKVLSGPCTPAK